MTIKFFCIFSQHSYIFRRVFLRLEYEEMTKKNSPKLAKKFWCECCDYECSKESDYMKHISTRKHQIRKNTKFLSPNSPKTDMTIHSCECGKTYKHQSSLWNHKKRCKAVSQCDIQPTSSDTLVSTSAAKTESNDTIMLLIQQNNDFKEMIIKQNQQIMELSRQQGDTNSHNNSHNKTFNMQFFLNETCKDAMNISDFVNSLKVTLQDLERVGELGYAEGISRMFVRGLSDLEITKRPIHCSDAKREVLHIKDQDKWEKDTYNQDKLKKAIKDLSNKNIMLLDDWRKENPGCDNYDHRKNDLYLRMMMESMGPKDNVCEKRDFTKIVKSIAKTTIIDKATEM